MQPATADLRFDEGHWRLELNGGWGVHQGGKDRSGDFKSYVVAEYEFPATQRLTLGLRLTPLFYYEQDTDNVVGAGVGLSTRLYAKKQEYRGLFGELRVDALGHHNRIEANSSNLNFQLGVGLGYQLKTDWYFVLNYEHISNASIGDRNAGANTLGLGIGYRF
jgi:hypothetical protein